MTPPPVPLSVHLDPSSPLPPFEQLRAHVVERIESGELAPGDRLPPVRALAAELGLAAGTVARAYRELEASGHVETGRRAGTTVAAGAHTRGVALEHLADALVAAARAAGLGDRATLDLVRAAQQHHHP